MQRIVRASTALLVSFAVVLPTIEAPQARENRKSYASERDANSGVDTSFIDRQQKMWGRLSTSICAGCITATNRVAPVNYDRPGTAVVAAVNTPPAKLETVRTAVRTAVTPRKFVALKKRYAKHHRRERLRLAARARQRAAILAKKRAMHVAALRRRPHQAPVRATFVPAYDVRSVHTVYRVPAGLPATPRDDGRWHETILPVALRLRRG